MNTQKSNHRLPSDVIDEILLLARAGKSITEITKSTTASRATVWRHVHAAGLPIPAVGSARKWPIDETVFDRLSPSSAYWLGLLMADGSVSTAGVIRLTLKSSDAYHVVRFLEFVGSGSRPLDRNGDACVQATVTSHHMAGVLASYGIVPRKTYSDPCVPVELASEPAFWLGLLDGDGCLSWHHNGTQYMPGAQFFGSKRLMDQCSAMLADYSRKPLAVSPIKSIYRVSISGAPAQNLLTNLLDSMPRSLDRKREIAQQMIAWRSPLKRVRPNERLEE